jgi:alpha-glucosidase
MPNITKKWWKEAVVYQIYPRSFMDATGDGVGDLRGIIHKLDYLKYLGINVIWICPMFKSPQDDNGYDVSDYQDIHGEYGTLADFDELVKGAHDRGIKMVLDLVLNHTSDEHQWFVESRSSKDSPKRDWYWWRDGKNGQEPNNWESIFGGSAWKYDEKTAQYFMHLFSAKQPDLNWENPAMRAEIYKMINWWMDRGIDGFRLDAVTHMKKEPTLADLPNPQGLEFVPSYASHMNIPGIQSYLKDLCDQTFNKRDVFTVGEANGVNSKEAHEWVGEDQKKLNMVIQFEHLDLWNPDPEKRIDLPKVKEVFSRWQKDMAGVGWNALYLENHDIPRIVSKWGDDSKYWMESATSLAAMYFLMQGTPFIYQGQEIGMTNTVFTKPEDFDDVRARNIFADCRAKGASLEKAVKELGPVSRDNARTPMQWDASAHGGFSTGRPWLKENPNFPKINVAAQMEKPGSVLEFYRQLIQLRAKNPVFVYGDYDLFLGDHPQLYAYTRTGEGKKAHVFTNLSGKTIDVTMPPGTELGNLVLHNLSTASPRIGDTIQLKPYEAQVYLA